MFLPTRPASCPQHGEPPHEDCKQCQDFFEAMERFREVNAKCNLAAQLTQTGHAKKQCRGEEASKPRIKRPKSEAASGSQLSANVSVPGSSQELISMSSHPAQASIIPAMKRCAKKRGVKKRSSKKRGAKKRDVNMSLTPDLWVHFDTAAHEVEKYIREEVGAVPNGVFRCLCKEDHLPVDSIRAVDCWLKIAKGRVDATLRRVRSRWVRIEGEGRIVQPDQMCPNFPKL